MLERFWNDLWARPGGPLSMRFVIQPSMAVVLAALAGLRDAKERKPAYLWAVATNPEHRRALLHDGWKDVAKLFTVAFFLDVVFQLVELRRVYPGEAVVVAAVLACVPYALVRGPTNRVARLARAAVQRRRLRRGGNSIH